jgi:hypothetical protein
VPDLRRDITGFSTSSSRPRRTTRRRSCRTASRATVRRSSSLRRRSRTGRTCSTSWSAERQVHPPLFKDSMDRYSALLRFMAVDMGLEQPPGDVRGRGAADHEADLLPTGQVGRQGDRPVAPHTCCHLTLLRAGPADQVGRQVGRRAPYSCTLLTAPSTSATYFRC